ncbi:MAG: prephenate dehydrogenase [Myxococcota bacterium]
MTTLFQRMAVLGLGLLGGSLAVAARRSGAVARAVGAARRREPLERALRERLVDEIGDPAAAVKSADLVVLACPVGAMEPLLASVAPLLSPGAIVTDVGSVKGGLADRLPALLPEGVHYVGSHPMAGSHLKGSAHARGDLFEGAPCAVTPLPDSDPSAVARVADLWTAVGARVVRCAPEAHDAEVAWTSHAPHVLAFAFAMALEKATPGVGRLAGGGFRDFTRIARSDAELWGDILSANRKALAGPLHDCAEALARLSEAVEAGDTETIERMLSAARNHLAAVTDANAGGEYPAVRAVLPRDGKSKGGRQEK